ncbi:bifunctional adenosylcobinamide kinase/adenosylcobinamide-phosphate guanylyltransferase [Ketobacter sp.]|uniref:bifunctional adenosylcobinamide kinase/adenosylcobinamide-phosphate guanylyltransferase n=1 Tax=Ketobacter sp. TaxID=2083498 RepID=UPI000F27F096|nr:bifunctional adenosylcobinamide kinase/adenosylcobinamide-phosphate guanylyltransferase [Ketobacter sp.]RLU00395.1 MAG: bifunctional adenosylcobinamide kinase/adenosylcobinamide-phosphate guanylyltransferase [Ketobacter sp.]
MIELILGGARSGKSQLAEQRALASNKAVVYVATAQNLDGEMAKRIDHHQRRRPPHWTTLEQPIALAQSLKQVDAKDTLILIDCLTLWVSNLLCLEEGHHFALEKQALLDLLPQMQSDVIMVSNETGLGVVPMGELSRRFVDESGWLHQALAALADQVTLVVAGLPLQLKPTQLIPTQNT